MTARSLPPEECSFATGLRSSVKERFNLRLQADFFNAFNVANFSGLNTTITSSSFGTLSSAYPPRQIQLVLKVAF